MENLILVLIALVSAVISQVCVFFGSLSSDGNKKNARVTL
jgi:hypothetical protein